MPNMANIVVKKADGTTDVTYTQQSASAGEGSPAIWRNLSVGTAAGHRPQLVFKTMNNGNGTARRGQLDFAYPSLVTDSGVTRVGDKFTASTTATMPLNMPAADLVEGVYQYCNLLAAALIKQALNEGFAPT